MGRLLRIAIYAFVILILYFWVTAIVASYNKNKKIQELPQVAVDSSEFANDTSLVTSIEEDVPSEMITNSDIINGNIDYNEVDEKVKVIEEVKKNTPPPPTAKNPKAPKPETQDKTTTKDNYYSGYGVIAGTFSDGDNAKKVLKLLKSKGFNNAKINKLGDKSLHQVVAGIYQSKNLADQKSRELKSAKIDNFVKKIK